MYFIIKDGNGFDKDMEILEKVKNIIKKVSSKFIYCK